MDGMIFIYGLTFFIVGLGTIIIALTNKTSYRFVDKLLYFGIFLLIKGLVEWEHLFFPIKSQSSNNELFAAYLGHHLFVALAMGFFTLFGIELLILINSKAKVLRYIFGVIALSFFTYFFIYPGNIFYKDIINWIISIENASRHYILLPGGLLAAGAVYLNTKDLLPVKAVKISNYGFSFLLASYSVLVGSFTLDYNNGADKFYLLTGLKLEVIEIIIIISSGVVIMTIISYLNGQYFNNRMKIRDVVLLDSERDRIARDMHDGAIQSLYALSLRLGYMKHLITKNSANDMEDSIIYLQESVNNVIQDIRNYIYNNLAEEYRYENLEKGIKNLIDEFKYTTQIDINFIYINKATVELKQEEIVNIYFVIKEAILNIIKHAKANKAEIRVLVEAEIMYVAIQDDGIGIRKSNKTAGMGLATIRKRVEQTLYGDFIINYNNGTLLEIKIPLGEGKRREQKSFVS